MQPPIIEEVTHLENSGKPDGAMDRLLMYMNSLYDQGMFEEADEILRDTDITKVSTDLLLTLILSSYHSRNYSENRHSFVSKVKIELSGRDEDIEALFKGLE